MLAEVAQQLVHHYLLAMVDAPRLEPVTLCIEKHPVHLAFVVYFFEVKAAQVYDMPWEVVTLFVEDVHDVVMKNVAPCHPRLGHLAHLLEVNGPRFRHDHGWVLAADHLKRLGLRLNRWVIDLGDRTLLIIAATTLTCRQQVVISKHGVGISHLGHQ